jgi:hypothetical protein
MEDRAAIMSRYHQFRKDHTDGKILATFTGRLETQDHFEVRTGVGGFQWPPGYRLAIARLLYTKIADVISVPWEPGEQKQEEERDRKPYATRAP